MNVEERVAALETLLAKVRTNAAQPRPQRPRSLFASADVAPPQDDVAGPPLPGIIDASTEIPAVPPKEAAPMEDLWAEAKPLAAPLPGTPKTPAVSTTPKPTVTAPAAKPAPATTAAKPAPATTAAKPAPATTAAKPALTPVAKPAPTTTAAKPAPVAATLPKTPAQPAAGMPKIAAQKPPEELKRTLQGVGEEGLEVHESAPPPDGRDSDAITAPLALNAEQIEALLAERAAEDEKKTARPAKPEGDKKLAEPEKKALEPAKTGLPSAIDEEGDEHEEPTQLYGATSSKRPDALEEIEKKAAEPEKKSEPEVISLEADKLPEPPKLAEPEKRAKTSEFDEISIAEELPEPDQKPAAEEKKPAAAAKSSEFDEISIAETLPEAEKPETKAAEPEKKPETKAAEPEKKPAPPIKKPVEAEATKKPEQKPAKKPDITPPEAETITKPEPKKGMPAWLLVAALLVLAGSGAFIALKQGWIGGKPGAPPAPVDTGATVTNPPPTAAPPPSVTATAAPTETPTATATQAPTAEPTAAPTASASAAPTASAEAAPSKDPAKLPATKALLIVTSNKPAQIFLTGKLVGNTGQELEVDCGPKFVRLAEPGETNPAKAKWMTPGQSGVVACQKLNNLTINVP